MISLQRSLVLFSGESFRDNISAVGVHIRLFSIRTDLGLLAFSSVETLLSSDGFCASHWPSSNFLILILPISFLPADITMFFVPFFQH